MTEEERSKKLEEIENIKLHFYQFAEQLEELERDNIFLYDENNEDCIPGFDKCKDLIDEYIFNLYKEVV